jgi:hypothetical protein
MSVRTGYPYVARHLPWYVDDRYLPEDEAFYRERAEGSDVNHWSRTRLPGWLAQAVAERRSRAKAAPSPPSPDNESQPAASLPLIGAWDDEPDPLDETRYTPWGEPGWHSWNGMSPEVEICRFIVALVEVMRPANIIETGTGQGFITRRINERLSDNQRVTCFESDSVWRYALRSLLFFDESRCTLSQHVSPSEADIAQSDLCILDSDFSLRLQEIERWWSVSRKGSVLFVHDAGNGHGPETPHGRVRSQLVDLGIPGVFLSNPRGAFVGVK